MPTVAPTTGDRIAALDGLRGIAVWLVLIHHFVAQALPREPGSWQAYLGACLGLTFSGVDLFFVISGFLIGGIVLDQHAAPNFLKVFYLRRALRIIPLYYLFLFLCWTVPLLVEGMARPHYSLGSYLLFLSNLSMTFGRMWDPGHPSLTWSLAVEEQFYLVLPFLALMLRPGHVRHLALAALITAPLLRVALLLWRPDFALGTHILLPCRMDSLAFGLTAAIFIRSPRVTHWLQLHPGAIPAIAVCCLPILAWLTRMKAGPGGMPMAALGYSALGLFYTCILLHIVVSPPTWLHRFLSFGGLTFSGRVSYFVYLFQGLIAWPVFRWLTGNSDVTLNSIHDLTATLLALALLLLAATISWRLIEKPLLALGRRHRYLDASAAPYLPIR